MSLAKGEHVDRRLRMAGRSAAIVCAVVIVLGTAQVASALWVQNVERIDPEPPSSWLAFGADVAMDNGVLVVGSSTPRVAVYEQELGSWALQQVLEPPAGSGASWFGFQVAIAGDIIVVGAPNSDDGKGAAFVFARQGSGTWEYAAKLVAADGADSMDNPPFGDRFGVDVAISADTIVVGATLADHITSSDAIDTAGAAYVFGPSAGSWSQQAKLTPLDPLEGARFGSDVDIDGDRIVVGAFGWNGRGFTDGAAYVFERPIVGTPGWAQTWRLTAASPPPAIGYNEWFGMSVAVSGDTIAVGAPIARDAAETWFGAVYVFEWDTGDWGLTASWRADELSAPDSLGQSVDLDGELLVAGAPSVWVEPAWTDQTTPNPGAAYLFHRSAEGWSSAADFVGDNGAGGDRYGWAVAVQGGTVAVGAMNEHGERPRGGAAYAYNVLEVPGPDLPIELCAVSCL